MLNDLLGAGLYIGINDKEGTPVHIGDTLEFDADEYGAECVFVIELKGGQIQHPGATSDIPNWCRVIRRVGT